MIYLDNAATTMKKPPQVIEAVVNAMQTFGNSSRGTHESSLDAAYTVYGARVRLAGLFGCPGPERVAFTSNVTESLNVALHGLLDRGDRVVTTDLEHNSVLRPLYKLRKERGLDLVIVPADRQGKLDLNDFDRLITRGTKLVVCTHASNLTGDVQDVRAIADIAHARGALVVVDAAQTAGTRKVDMNDLGADVLCFTGHKGLMGPQGTGGLCIGENADVRPFKVGGTGVQSYSETQPEELPTRLEAGTLNGHGIAGLSGAVDFINEIGVETIQRHEEALTQRFLSGVRDLPGVRVYGDFNDPHTAVVALNIRDYPSADVSDALSQDYGIATRPGAHCAPRLHRALGTEGQGAVRFSFSWFTTEEEIDAAVAALRELTSPD